MRISSRLFLVGVYALFAAITPRISKGRKLILSLLPEAKTTKRLLVGVWSATMICVSVSRAPADTLYVTELFGSDVIKVDSTGNKTVFATGLNLPRGIAVDAIGNVFVADNSIDIIYEYSPTGAQTTFATRVSGGPMGMTFDASGNLFVGTQAGTIYRYDPAGNRALIATNLGTSQVTNLAFASNGDLYAAYPDANAIHRFTASGDGTFVGASTPVGLAFDSIGNLFVTDNGNGVITKYNSDGAGTVVANSGLFAPWSLVFGSQSEFYVANAGGHNILRYDSDGTVSVFTSGLNGSPGFIADVAAVPAGLRYEAETLTLQVVSGATHSVITDPNLSGGAGTQLNATAAGQFVTYTVPVPTSARTYKVKLGVKTGPKSGIFRLSIDGVNQGKAQNEYTSTVAYSARDLGIVTFFSGGNKAFKFLVSGKNAKSGGYGLVLDYIELVPTNRLETESLKVQSITPKPSGYSSAQWYGVFNATAASGGAGTYFNANALGNYITYTVPVALPGTYHVRVGVQTKPNKGIFQLAVNGLDVGQSQDEFDPSITYGVRDLGTASFATSGNYPFKFAVTGKNPRSTGYTLAFDFIELIP